MGLGVCAGMLVVYTGDGKGKTTAALGAIWRALGHNKKVCLVQFMKGTWPTGELDPLERNGVELIRMGKGFYKILDDKFSEDEHRRAAEETIERLRGHLKAKRFDLYVLDEINLALQLGLICDEHVHDVLSHRGEADIICTGRNAPATLINAADLVTNMVEVKHPFHNGITAKKGLDF